MFWILIIIIISFAISRFSTIVHLFPSPSDPLVSQQSFPVFMRCRVIFMQKKLVGFCFASLLHEFRAHANNFFQSQTFFLFSFHHIISFLFRGNSETFSFSSVYVEREDDVGGVECRGENEKVELVSPSQPSLLINIQKTRRDFPAFLWTWKLKSSFSLKAAGWEMLKSYDGKIQSWVVEKLSFERFLWKLDSG